MNMGTIFFCSIRRYELTVSIICLRKPSKLRLLCKEKSFNIMCLLYNIEPERNCPIMRDKNVLFIYKVIPCGQKKNIPKEDTFKVFLS